MSHPVVSELFVHPLKSAAPVPVREAVLDALGVVGDRRWMVVDEDGVFLSQRELPRMALLRARSDGRELVVEAPGVEPLHVDTPPSPVGARRVTVWDDSFDARPASPLAAAWCTRFLGVACSLVYCPPDALRAVDPTYANAGERVGFADGFPLLVIGQASLDHLNERLTAGGGAPVPMNRFRPNIVIAGTAPHAEDAWRRITIGLGAAAVVLDLVKPCARCSIVPVDQNTGIRGKEPLTTLSRYRLRQGKVYFGQNALHRSLGTIHVGAPVHVDA